MLFRSLKEAGEVLDIMRLEKEDQYGYNRYMDSLSLKASEIFTLQTEAEFKVREDESNKKTEEIAKNGILKGYDNSIIADLTSLSTNQIEELRNELRK